MVVLVDQTTGLATGTFALKQAKDAQDVSTKKEIELLAQLDHENILKLEDHFKSGGNAFVVTEFCGGGDLEQVINQHKSHGKCISPELVWKWSCQMLKGMNYLHQNRKMHRDLKPANIFIMTDGTSIKLADFGLAKDDAGVTTNMPTGCP